MIGRWKYDPVDMHFQEGFFYHIYNQANRKETIFRDREDYLYFISRVKRWIHPVGSILAYCVMPNHYHFLILANSISVKHKRLGLLTTNELSNGFRITQSQYGQYYNRKYESVGSVFRPKTKSKDLNNSDSEYLTNCFIYVHQNPVNAGLCEKVSDWEYSSASDYFNQRQGTLIDKTKAYPYVLIDWSNFDSESSRPLLRNEIDNLF